MIIKGFGFRYKDGREFTVMFSENLIVSEDFDYSLESTDVDENLLEIYCVIELSLRR